MTQKIILTYGTFDLFHIGHLRLLKRLKQIGDRLIVGVSSDKFNLQKGKKTIVPLSQRIEILESIAFVDKIIVENSWEQKEDDIKNNNVTTFAMGDDWSGKFDYLKQYCDVIYLPRTKSVSSSQIKQEIKTNLTVNDKELKKQSTTLNKLTRGLK